MIYSSSTLLQKKRQIIGFVRSQIDEDHDNILMSERYAMLRKYNDNHARIHKLLGGTQRSFKVKPAVMSTEEKSDYLHKRNVMVHERDLHNYIPDFFRVNNADHDNICKRTHTSSGVGGVKYLRKWLSGYSHYTLDKAESLLSYIYSVLTSMEYASVPYYVELTIDPMAFVRLGHYKNIDDCHTSCWQEGGDRTYDKYALMGTRNSFVILIKDINRQLKYRAWGLVQNNSVIISNMYPNQTDKSPLVGSIIASVLAKLTKKTVTRKIVDSNTFRLCGIYVNYGCTTFKYSLTNQQKG